MNFISFTSGSCGNCYYLGTPDGGLFIDAGASLRRVKRILLERGVNPSLSSSVLVTHDHLDHMRYLGSFCKHLNAGVYSTAKLQRVFACHNFTKDQVPSRAHTLRDGDWNIVGGFRVRFFEVPHDATQTVGYAVSYEGGLFVLMTDLGHVTPQALEWARKADTVVIESNYDYEMLCDGPYPPELKKRILDEGHLSNADCARAIKQFYHPGLRNLFLCHLSGNNNTVQKAYESASEALREIGVPCGTVYLRVLERGVPSPTISL